MARRVPPKPAHTPYVVERLGPRDRTEILEHLRALDPADRVLRFGVAADDAAIARYVEGLAFERDAVLGARSAACGLLGVAHVAFGASGAELGLSVAAGERRRGLGRQLAAAALREAERLRADAFRVHCAATNTGMRRIAEHLGLSISMEGSDMLGRRPLSAARGAAAGAATDDRAPEGDENEVAHLRSQYVHEAEPIGSVPPPGTLRGMVTTGLNKLGGRNPEVLIDKLGERLAFERTGTRLYEAMIMKCIALESAGETVPLADLERLRDEEAEHFVLLAEVLTSLGADPTAQTPGADVTAVQSAGILQVIADPRTNLAQSLNALLSAELVDHAGWELLVQLAEQMGQGEWASRFRAALAQESEHRIMVQGWLQSMVLAEA